MKTRLLTLMAAIVMIGFTGCKKAADDTSPSLGTTKSDAVTYCGTPQVCPLTAGQTINAGTLTVANDATNLYVIYTISDDAIASGTTFGTLHLWVGTDLTLVPSTKKGPNAGIPIPGKFPYIAGNNGLPSSNGTTTYTFTIPLKLIPFYDVTKCGVQPIYVIAHAEMAGGSVGTQTAFGGCFPVNKSTDITSVRWYFYAMYTPYCCGTPPPDNGKVRLGTAFAYGGYVFTTDKKSNPDNLKSLGLTLNRWGWANNMPTPTTIIKDLWVGAGLNNTTKALLVGQATITWDGTFATVKYDLKSPYTLEEVHVYADDFKPTTLAPGQYGNTDYLDPQLATSNTYTFSGIDLVDTYPFDGAWFIVHAVIWGPGVTNP